MRCRKSAPVISFPISCLELLHMSLGIFTAWPSAFYSLRLTGLCCVDEYNKKDASLPYLGVMRLSLSYGMIINHPLRNACE